MPTRRKREDHSWELPRVRRAAIYLCEFGTDEPDLLRNVPSVDQQRALCRCVATVLHAEVIGEFVDKQRFWWPSRQGLHKVVELAGQGQRLDYLIVSSRDRLAGDCDEAFEVAWRLGLAGTVVVPADAEHEIPWTDATPPSRD